MHEKDLIVTPFVKKEEIKHIKKQLPSVYIILLDEYAGNESLKKNAGFNNEEFTSALKNMGFTFIADSKSNYNHTVYSTASFLNGDYNSFRKDINDKKYYKQSLKSIAYNRTTETFKELGYGIVNLSPFNLQNQNRYYKSYALPANSDLILRSTFIDDIQNNALFYITRRLPNINYFEKLVIRRTAFNNKICDSILRLSNKKNIRPSFVYAHLNMPHAIYARDSSGRVNTDFLTKKTITKEDKKNAYLEYLIYTNRCIIPFIKELKRNANDSAIIVLMSDHGYREFALENDYHSTFNNLKSIYLPNAHKEKWYKGMTNVNFIRTLFSEIIGKNIPLFKDSCVY
jgi:hypothetical protein